MIRPQTCYYKVLNVSTQSQPKEIKQAYYQLAKKYHPDSFLTNNKAPSEAEFNEIDLKFKGITEAYSVLSDSEKRAQYDRLIFGEGADTSREFNNQQAYDYWSDEKQSPKGRSRDYDKQQREVRERLRNYKDYSDFLKAYESHRDTHEARSTLYREEGFRNLNDKYGTEYDHYSAGDDPKSEVNKDYFVYRERYYEKYWDTKANAEYYSQPLRVRAWITLKKVTQFYWDFAVLWLGVTGLLVLINARSRKQPVRK